MPSHSQLLQSAQRNGPINSRPRRRTTYNPYWEGSSDSDDGPTVYIGGSDEEAVVTYPRNWPRRKPVDPDYDADGEDAAMAEPRRRVLKRKVISFKFAAPVCRFVNPDVASKPERRSTNHNPYWAAWISEVDRPDVDFCDGNNNLVVTDQSNRNHLNEPSDPEKASVVPISISESVMSSPKEPVAPSSPPHVHETAFVMSLNAQFDDNGPNFLVADAMDATDYQWIEAIADTCLDADASEFPAPPPIFTLKVDKRDTLFKDSDGMDYMANTNAKAAGLDTSIRRTISNLGEENVPPRLAHFKDPMLDFADLTKTATTKSICIESAVKKRRTVQRKAEKKSPVSTFNCDASVVELPDRETTSSLFMNWINAPIIRSQPCPYLPTTDDGPLDDPIN